MGAQSGGGSGRAHFQGRKSREKILRITGDEALMTEGKRADEDVGHGPFGGAMGATLLDLAVPGLVGGAGVGLGPFDVVTQAAEAEKLLLLLEIPGKNGT